MSLSRRFADFVRSLIDEHEKGHEEGQTARDRSRFGGYAFDPDYAEAMQDLEYFVRTGFERPRQETSRQPGGGQYSQMPIAVRRAFRALEVAPGTRFDQVSRSYKRLIAEYHPDRHAANPQRAEAATEVSKRLNLAYRAIRDYYIVIGSVDP